MEDATTATCAIELIVLRALPTAVRCRELDGSAVTYRKSLAHVVPGLRLTVRPERRWKFRRTDGQGQLDVSREPEKAVLRSLVGRARLHARAERPAAAAADLHLALTWDPADSLGARRELERLQRAGEGDTGGEP